MASRCERRELGFLAQDRRLDRARERAAVVLQHVGGIEIEAQRLAHQRREVGEAAGHQRAGGAVLLHGGDQGGAARHVADAPGRLVEPGDRQALQQADALLEGGGEIDLAVHGARGDAGDLLAQAQEVGQLVQHLVLDHGRFHVGHQQLLAPAGRGTTTRVERGHGQAGRRALERDVAGDFGRQPVGRADRGVLGAQRVDGICDRAVVAARAGRDCEIRTRMFFTPPALAICRCACPPWPSSASSSSPARRPAASRRWRLRSPERARRHGDQRRRHADLRCLPDPDRAAHGARSERGAAPALRRAAAVGDAVGRALARPWLRQRSSAAWPRVARPSCAAARASISGP